MKLLKLFASFKSAESKHKCPICGSTDFGPYNNRPLAQCKRCKSLERGRLLWMSMDRLGALPQKPMRVLHIAPEVFFIARLHKLYGDDYRPMDIEPTRYKNRYCEVERIDLCSDLNRFESESFDLIIHNHVLEHIPCDVASVLTELNRILAVDGMHFFSVPFRRGVTRENLSTALSEEERIKQFGQADHLRIFGTDDFLDYLAQHFGTSFIRFDPLIYVTENDIKRANIQVESLARLDGNSIFYYKKP